MLARMRSGMSGVTAIMLMVMALWMWTRSAQVSLLLATQPMHPQLELWAVRFAAVAAAAGAQWVLLNEVVPAFYFERRGDEMAKLIVGMVGSMAMVGALVLAVSGR